ncbi:hypothetical protein BD560DRAFT_149495 [Blakeslea trispora]|nr:hypothetical protein BD560DRAFT_149495 [Blakeslea trispora]
MLWSYQLKHSLVFMAEGLKVTFFVCCVSSGICLMTEVDCLNLPSTFDEFVDFGSQVDKLYNLACLYDQHCVPGDAVYEQWSLLSYDAIKLTYDLHTTTKASTAKVDNSPEAASSTEVCL